MRWLAFPKIAVGLALAVLAALALVGINEAGYRQSSHALIEIDNAQRDRLAVNILLQNILDAESGQRGYLLTGDDSYGKPYDTAVKNIEAQLAVLRSAYAGRPEESQRLNQLAAHLASKLEEMATSVRLKKEGKEEALRFLMTNDVGRQEMEAVRADAAALDALGNQALVKARGQIASALNFARLGIGLVALIALLAFFLYLRQAHTLRRAGERQQETLQRERNALEDEVRERTATLAELATHLQDVRESERGYLARELHDELGSLLTAAKLDVARLKSRLSDAPDAGLRLQHLNELLNSGIALKRRIIEDLRPSSLSNLGLIASLEILGREFAERTGVEVEMVLEPVKLNDADQLTVYRMVQESLTNISKYAGATSAHIVMKNQDQQVVVEVSDDGEGFDLGADRPSSHGLAGMRHRVEAAGGSLTVSSDTGKGTRLAAVLPALAA
ncbi:Signal transduction histidine kinase [Burkholderiales bacterium 8X]|nr:Signal transduction histidine kinase [Burkholderiales bacterium 8X]